MLDYNKLEAEFDQVLASISDEEIQKWIQMDDQRLIDQVLHGEKAVIDYQQFKIARINDYDREVMSDLQYLEVNYAMAA